MAHLKARHERTIECQSPQLSGSTEILPSVLELKYAELETDMSPRFVSFADIVTAMNKVKQRSDL